ncbi:hypothetical protein [Acinetobacter sp. NigerLNRRAM0016]
MSKNAIATALLSVLVPENAIEKLNVEGLGDIGIKLFTAGERSELYTANKDLKGVPFYAVVMKATVVDPETGELALNDLSFDDLARLPPTVMDDFVAKTFHLNGFVKREKSQAEEDLKN